MKFKLNGNQLELVTYVPDYYCFISEISNRNLDSARESMKTWVPTETLRKMNVSLCVYQDDSVNAFATQQGDGNYIALSVGLLQQFFDE